MENRTFGGKTGHLSGKQDVWEETGRLGRNRTFGGETGHLGGKTGCLGENKNSKSRLNYL